MADINYFYAVGGIGFIIRELIEAGLVHEDVSTVFCKDLNAYGIEAKLSTDGCVVCKAAFKESGDHKVLAGWKKTFLSEGGLRVLSGDLETAIIKVSFVKPEYRQIKAPVLVFNDQEELQKSFQFRALHDKDFIAVIRYYGLKATGMLELHKLTTI